MLVAGTNFSLFYLVLHQRDSSGRRSLWKRLSPLFGDPEYRVYLAILLVATAVLTSSLFWSGHYATFQSAVRHSLFNVVSIMTTTGFGTENFHEWNEFSKGLLLLLMFVGGCAGSTAGGIKVVRVMLFAKIILLEIEQAFRPNVVRPLKVFGIRVENSLRHEVVVYFSLVLVIFISSWMLLAAIEPDDQWLTRTGDAAAGTVTTVDNTSEKLLDCASAVAATLNNIGPGLGVLGPHSNYSEFSPQGKVLLTVLMLLGRLELFAILVLFVPAFWRLQ
jgi:trk system potassium uptake protein TrkH